MQIQKILVPVDGSEYSDKAAQYAADFAKLVDANVLLLNCRMQVPPMLGPTSYEEAKQGLTARAEEVLAPYKKIMKKAGVVYTATVLEGPVEEAIVQLADAEQCDLIIMGSRGHSDLEGLLVGSATHRVLQITNCPVTVIR